MWKYNVTVVCLAKLRHVAVAHVKVRDVLYFRDSRKHSCIPSSVHWPREPPCQGWGNCRSLNLPLKLNFHWFKLSFCKTNTREYSTCQALSFKFMVHRTIILCRQMISNFLSNIVWSCCFLGKADNNIVQDALFARSGIANWELTFSKIFWSSRKLATASSLFESFCQYK